MPVTIVMYHYVRDLRRSRFPETKGLDIADFREQLDYLQANYAIIGAEELISAATEGAGLPPNAAVLTFDDGYLDHFTYVLPVLLERGLKGLFFPPVRTTLDRQILDLNKIHFVLASVEDKSQLVTLLKELVDEHGAEWDLQEYESYWQEHGTATRFDPAEVAFIKRMTQFALPVEMRATAAAQLFEKFVTADEAAFAEELYMSVGQLKTLIRCGMYVGSHSATHPWLNTIDRAQQEFEVDRPLEMLAALGAPTENWVMCYPSGSFDDSFLDILRSRGCAVGLTTRVDIADLAKDDPLLLPRLDTNDLPRDGSAVANEWTRKVSA